MSLPDFGLEILEMNAEQEAVASWSNSITTQRIGTGRYRSLFSEFLAKNHHPPETRSSTPQPNLAKKVPYEKSISFPYVLPVFFFYAQHSHLTSA